MRNKEFEKYFNQYYDQAIGYTTKKVDDIDSAEDLVMSAFYACFSKYDTFDTEKATFATWFYFVLNNKIKNYYRDSKHHDDIEDVAVAVETFEDETVAAIELSNVRDKLKLALDSLNETQRKIVVLKYFQNLDAVEISKILGMSHSNVRVQLMRAIQKMRTYFEKNCIEWEA